MIPTDKAINERTNYFYKITWNEIKVKLRTGDYLAANIYRPAAAGRFPVLISLGPYGKNTHYLNQNPMTHTLYSQLQDKSPLLSCGMPDPEYWVPQGYIVVKVDQRGTGDSPGKLEIFSETSKKDYYDTIEWAGTQSWSNGKVGLLGFSYYATMQWLVAAEQPPHLTCMIVWEGSPDLYSDAAYSGGILSDVFFSTWWETNVLPHQYDKNFMSEEQLENNRADLLEALKRLPLRNEWWKSHSANLDNVKIPLLSAGNWFSAGLFARGNIIGFLNAASEYKWLEMHIGSHFVEFYNEESRIMQKQFLDFWLKGIDTGLLRQPKVKLAIPKGSNDFVWHYDDNYPLKNTSWTKYYLNAALLQLVEKIPSESNCVSYEGDKARESADWPRPMQKQFNLTEVNPKHILFKTAPFKHKIQITGPIKLHLCVSSSVEDLDIFVTLRNIDPYGKEIVNNGCYTSHYPISQGWLRGSLRKVDSQYSTDYKPYYTYDEIQKLIPGKIYPLEIEIWDSAIIINKGHSLLLEIGSQDQSGCSLLMHTGDERIWNADVTVYTGMPNLSYLLLPIIPT